MSYHLFEFITLRPLQLIQERDRAARFIELPVGIATGSHFLATLLPDSIPDVKRAIVERGERFSNRLDKGELRFRFRAYLDLHKILVSESYRTSFAELGVLMTQLEVDPLNTSDQVLIWDNLTWYVLGDSQPMMEEMLSSILVVHKFVIAFNSFYEADTPLTVAQEQELRKVLQAKVVFPFKARFPYQQDAYLSLSARDKERLSFVHQQLMHGVKRDQLVSLTAELNQQHARAMAEERERWANQVTTERERILGNIASLELNLGEEAVNKLVAPTSIPRKKEFSIGDLRASLSSEAQELLLSVAKEEEKTNEVFFKLAQQIEDLEDLIAEEIELEEEDSISILGEEINLEDRLQDCSWVVSSQQTENGMYNYFLVYYCEGAENRLERVTGSMSYEDVRLPVGARPIRSQQANIQLFQLNETPVSSEGANFEISVNRIGEGDTPATLLPFQVFEALPAYGVAEFEGPHDFTTPPDPLYGVTRLGVADFRRVEQDLLCYEVGEVSHVENIMAREYKERIERSFQAIERELELKDEFTTEDLRENVSTNRLEMQNEASTVVNQAREVGFNASSGFNLNIKKVFSLNGSVGYNVNRNTSREDSNTQALTTAKEVTNKIEQRILQKRSVLQRSKTRKEHETTNKHGYDNREGDQAVVSVFRFLDKVFTNRLVNYQAMLTYEFMVPRPAQNLIRTIKNQQEKEAWDMKKPRSLAQMGLKGPKGLTRKNYHKFAARLGVEVEKPHPRWLNLSRAFKVNRDEFWDNSWEKYSTVVTAPRQVEVFNDMEIPDDYRAELVSWSTTAYNDGIVVPFEHIIPTVNNSIIVKVGGVDLPDEGVFQRIPYKVPGSGTEVIHQGAILISGNLPVMIQCYYGTAVVTIQVRCRLKKSIFRAWQLRTYQALKEAYLERKEMYEDALEAYQKRIERDDLKINPKNKRQLMEMELKRCCIEMITRPFGIRIDQNHYGKAPRNRFRPIKLNSSLDEHADLVKFLEQAVNWHLMAYIFYPYFYGHRRSWMNNLQASGEKGKVFQRFLTSGMARVVVPIRKGFELAFMHYLNTGEVWLGENWVMNDNNELYLSVAEEMMHGMEPFVVEETWESRVPTNLTIIQDGAAAFGENGLPCYRDANTGTTRIAVGNSLLAPSTSPNTDPDPA